MAIDKIIPRFLVSDKDERLLEEGAMTDALNVTVSENGDQSEGALKAMKGTIGASASALSDLIDDGNSITAIGSVTDDVNGKIYFFVADDSGTTQDAIYQYDTTTNTYRSVYKSSYFNFSPSNSVKADIVRRDFNDSGQPQTVIYFTDGVNPPRKINVDRALAGDYGAFEATGHLDFAFQSIKAAPNLAPTYKFETDSTLELNNFNKDTFQFATQLIYTDGEESALSPYSKLAFSRSVTYQGMPNSSGKINDNNVCKIKMNWSASPFDLKYVADVAKIRLLARRGNDGVFFKIDEFNPTASISRNIYGSNVNIFDAVAQEYKWYNEGVYASVDPTTVNKMFDNIPFTAEGQAIAGNRLFYSNYTEGRDNVATSVLMNVNYEKPPTSSTDDYTATSSSVIQEATSGQGTASNGDIFITLVDGALSWPEGSTNASGLVPAGTTTTISFNYNPQGFFYGSPYATQLLCIDPNNQSASGYNGNAYFTLNLGTAGGSGLQIDLLDANANVSATITNATEITVADLANLFMNKFENEVTATKSYTISGQGITGVISGSGTSNFNPQYNVAFGADVSVSYAFEAVVHGTNDGDFVLKPYITNATFTNPTNSPFSIYAQSFVSSDEQSDLNYNITNTTSYLNQETADSNAVTSFRSFKAGCTHELGIVYFDKFNRSGFVNKLGSFYVKPFSDRSAGEEGPASVTLTMDHEPPYWASAWQLVYPGASTYESFVTYTTGGGYVPTDPDQSIPIGATNTAARAVTGKKHVYVSLNTLEKYKTEKSSLRDYSFTVGDKLRVISYDSDNDATPDIDYVKANDGSPVEFDIIGVEILSTSNNPLAGNAAPVPDYLQGTFLVLEAPAVESNLQVDTTGSGATDTGLKFTGWDWFTLSNTSYPDGTAASFVNYWGRNSLVEILTPRKTVSDQVYYEVGETHRANVWDSKYNTQHGPTITLTEGDVHWRQIATSTPFYSTDWVTPINNPDTWRFEEAWVETSAVSDFFSSKDWSRGRAHAPFERAAERRVDNGIIFGDAYAEDVENLSLTSFNPSLGNFDSVESSYGPLRYLGNYNDDLVGLQQNKLSLIPVGKNIIEYAGGSSNVAVSTDVLGQKRYSTGDYGCGNNPEAVLIKDNTVYFVDKSRQAVCVLSGGQLTPISEKNMSSFFEEFFSVSATKYVSGYDPRDNFYYITRLTSDGSNQSTVGYDASRGVWQSRYSFTPDVYADVDNMMYSAKYKNDTTDLMFWRHDDDTNRNVFHGEPVEASSFQVVSKLSPSKVKVFKSISIEGDGSTNANWDISPGITTDLGQLSGTITSFTEDREGSYYAAIPRDTSSNSTSQYLFIGVAGSVSSGSATVPLASAVRIDRLPANVVGLQVFYKDDDGNFSVAGLGNRYLSVYTSTSLILSGGAPSAGDATDKALYVKTHNDNGDVMRGHWAKINLTNTALGSGEIYSINLNVSESKYHSSLGEQ